MRMKGGDRKSMKAQTIITIVLGVLLLGALGFIGYSQIQKMKADRQLTAYATYEQGRQIGMQQGYVQVVGQLYTEALKCQPVPVTYNNQTINVIAVECLQQKE